MKTPEILFEFARDYDMRAWIPRNETTETLYTIIHSLLDTWARSIPEDKFNIIRHCLQRPVDYIVNHQFTIESISLRTREIDIVYCNPETDSIEMRFTIAPKMLLIHDVQRGMKEIAFPYY